MLQEEQSGTYFDSIDMTHRMSILYKKGKSIVK